MTRKRIAGALLSVLIGALGLGALSPAASAATKKVPAKCSAGYVALTFDDGPSAKTTAANERTLNAAGARATFFDIGANAQERADLVRLQGQVGAVENHSYSHPDFSDWTEPDVFNELLGTNQILGGITGQNPTLFRPPYNVETPDLSNDSHTLGMTLTEYTLDSYDYTGISASAVAANVRQARSGDIVLLHEGLTNTQRALPTILTDLTKRGLCAGQMVPTESPTTNDWGQSINVTVAKW